MFIVMPVIWCLLIAGLFGQGMIRDVPVGVVNLDHQPESIELEAKLDALPSVKLVSYDSPLEAQKAVKVLGGEITATLPVKLPEIEDKRAVIYIKKIKPTPKTYPRKAGTPERNPIK